mmetsp:Transcript_28985/g.56737  ORF Transcript_28985/g.56737 Transcript_28985/m.56737 type:complete len:237 (-) Transcript_28985:337-1047(-)
MHSSSVLRCAARAAATSSSSSSLGSRVAGRPLGRARGSHPHRADGLSQSLVFASEGSFRSLPHPGALLRTFRSLHSSTGGGSTSRMSALRVQSACMSSSPSAEKKSPSMWDQVKSWFSGGGSAQESHAKEEDRPAETPVSPLEARRKQMLYRSKQRGWLELDVVIGRFAEERLSSLSETELDEFEQILSEENPDLFKWVSGQLELPKEYENSGVMKNLQEFCKGGQLASSLSGRSG